MKNNIVLTDDELSLIQTSLKITIASYEKYTLANEEINLDVATVDVIENMKQLHDRLLREYF